MSNLGFLRVAAMTPDVRVADVAFNVEQCALVARTAAQKGAQLIVLPECALSAYTIADLNLQQALVEAVQKGLADLAAATADLNAVIVVGLPLAVNGTLYNTAAVLLHGQILGVVPKRYIPTYNEFYEGRWFAPGPFDISYVTIAGQPNVPFGRALVFCNQEMPAFKLGIEICEDLWAPNPPSIGLTQAGATIIANLSASTAQVGKAAYRRELVSGQSARLICAYLYASAGWGESTQDVVFSGHNLIAENGKLLAEAAPFAGGTAITEVDLAYLEQERRRNSTYETAASPEAAGYTAVNFSLNVNPANLTRHVDPYPFVPQDPLTRAERCEDILTIQAWGLAKRLQHTGSKCVVIGVSGGLDSTLALLVAARTFDLLQLDRAGIVAVTMPGFGTTGRTYGNAVAMSQALGCQLQEIPIAAAVRQHFADIGQSEDVHDVTYENSQARERTQILMDLANRLGGLVIGTGDLSELALGWATYNGDHMSMYGVNGGVPKTLVRHLVAYETSTCGNDTLSQALLDVLDTPVSPELLPATADDTIAQKTEDLVGPYELHDFFLYQVLRQGFEPAKVFNLAVRAFIDQPQESNEKPTYERAEILKWLRTFYRRFFAQQFKRSCLPDGPKVGSVAVSPRGDLRMPSDACATLWLAEVDALS